MTDPGAGMAAAADAAKVYVSNLPGDITELELRYVFGSYGTVTQIDVLDASKSATGQACAFVTYSTAESAQTSIRTLHNAYKIRVNATGPISVASAAVPAPKAGGAAVAVGTAPAAVGMGACSGTPGAVPGGAAPVDSSLLAAAQMLLQQPATAQQLLGAVPALGATQQTTAPSQFGQSFANGHVPAGEQACKLFVGDLPGDITKEALEQVFSTYGIITAARVMPGRARSGAACAFIEYSTTQSASTAIATLNQQYEIRPGSGPITVRYFEGGKGRGKAAATGGMPMSSLGGLSVGQTAGLAAHIPGVAMAAQPSLARYTPY